VARKAVPPLVKQVYKPKQREEVQKMEGDPERTTGQDIIHIGSMGVPIILEKMAKDRLFQKIRL
jgi:hypothetical protein